MKDEYGEAELIQWAEVVRDWERDPPGAFLVDARCLKTGRIFADGYYPTALEITNLEMVHCPHCRDFHKLRIVGEPKKRTPIRLVRETV
jgi:hypothetical protein